MRVGKKVNPRTVVLIGILIAVMILFGFRDVDFQVITADEYSTKNASYTAVSTKIKATRGNIVDRYGRPIATNRDGYNVVLNSAYLKKDQYNSAILGLTTLFKMYGEEWNDALPMLDTLPPTFTDDEAAVKILKQKLGLNTYATAENCYDEMISRYDLKSYSTEEKRMIMGIRYSMEKADFSVSNPYTFGEDISSELMLDIAETMTEFRGIELDVVTYRQYNDPELAPHIVGTIGKINSDEWKTLKDKNYSYDDYVGKSGSEKAFEGYLKGEDGKLTYYFDKSGNVVYSEMTVQPIQGDTVFLTIDSKLQKVAQEALSNNIKKLNAGETNITGGAVVITDIKSGEILASANEPSYNFTDYYANFAAVSSASNNPLFDRAFRGLYPPGSAYKPLVATAGLQENVIDRYWTIFCSKKYTYYDDYQPSCMHYHGNVNVITALSQSCNYFFFDVGRQVGISRLNEYSKLFGLGVKTGVETTESSGVLAGPEHSKSLGTAWYDGMTISAAIGQSDNAFTPLQLSVFTATIANDGLRYKATLLNSVKATDTGEYVYIHEPYAAADASLRPSVVSTVKEGMLSVTSEGTASAYFSDYAVKVGGKTGTAQTVGADNSVLIIFAPYEDPEIAISIVVEHGEKSTSTGPVAKAILDEYFFGSAETDDVVMPDTLV